MKREYIVTLHKGEDYVTFYNEMADKYEVSNPRRWSKRNTHYLLTEDEVAEIKLDERVLTVDIPIDEQEHIFIKLGATQTADFDRPQLHDYDVTKVNWGLRRCIDATNPYTINAVTGDYTFSIDGEGVDIVISDSGIQADHPEFLDEFGVSRVQQIDWFAASGVPGTMPAGHYTDYEGHGTHCAGIAAGKTFGWAKKARIYAVKVDGLQGPSDPNGGISTADCFDVITGWHNNKPIDPKTGYKRPTIVNMSWSFYANWNNFTSLNYRDVAYPGDKTSLDFYGYGLVPLTSDGGLTYKTNIRYASIDADVQNMIDAGIHICCSAGNNYHKIDTTGGADYDNYVVANTGTIYYHRGASPFDDEAFTVGNVDSYYQSGGSERKAASSESGPGTNIWAPGTRIMSSTSTINDYGIQAGPYYDDTSFSQVILSGTSMASPQVCGLGACLLQINPHWTPAQLRDFIFKNSKSILWSTGLDNDYKDQESLIGSPNRMIYTPFHNAIAYKLQRT